MQMLYQEAWKDLGVAFATSLQHHRSTDNTSDDLSETVWIQLWGPPTLHFSTVENIRDPNWSRGEKEKLGAGHGARGGPRRFVAASRAKQEKSTL